MEGLIAMRREELSEYEVIRDFIKGLITRKEAAKKLGLKERAVSYRAKRIRNQGINGAFHGNKGRAPKNKKSEHTKHRYLAKRKQQYSDFNVMHAWEMIREESGSNELETVSYPTLFRWCQREGLLKHKQRRRRKARSLRARRPIEGMLLQMDGSDHRWNGEDEWTLIWAIDDATSEIPAAEFFNGETTRACLSILYQIVSTKGIPDCFYIDCASWGGGQKQQNFSHFEEACKALGIQIIYAHSAQAKGRIERGNRTHQDRLIPLLQLDKIKLQADANKYLKKTYIPTWNKRFTVNATESGTRYREAPTTEQLKEIICIKEQREARADGCISLGNVIYQLRTKEGFSPVKGTFVEVRNYVNGEWAAFVYGKEAKVGVAPANRQPDPKYLQKIRRGNKTVESQMEKHLPKKQQLA